MKCPQCNSNLVINSKGVLECPACSNTDKQVELLKVRYNDFEFFKVLKVHNLVLGSYLLQEDVIKLIKQGVKVIIKQEEDK